MKLALGLFHFNPHWNLDARSAHRHCTEALSPLLRSVHHHPTWRLTIEVSGSGLEFIHRAYPGLFGNLKALVENGQVELISSLYTPSLWVAFPLRDLVTSIELNRQCVDRLGLPWSRIFFAQEAFFGTGVSALQEYFDVAICKDDYIDYYYDIDWTNPCFTMRGLKVVVASSHLVSELACWTQQANAVHRVPLRSEHIQHLNEASMLNNFPARRGVFQGITWAWYHCGDGNHFGTVYKPDNLERCYYDPIWSELCARRMEALEEEGYRLATLAQFVAGFDYRAATELPPLVEAGWNPRRSEGVFCWMGRNDTPWENDVAVLTSIARARKRLIDAETLAQKAGRRDTEVSVFIDKGWMAMMHAQISDSVGWFAGPQAVQNSLLASDETLNAAVQALDALWAAPVAPAEISNRDTAESWPEPAVFGAEGAWTHQDPTPSSRVYECYVKVRDSVCGVRFPFEKDELVFCPSGMEETPVMLPRNMLKVPSVSLPLANGLLQIADDLFLVKDTTTIHLAAIVSFEDRTVEYRISGARAGKEYWWRFHLIRDVLDSAVALANVINAI
jgi:hypothetical protein